MMFKVAKWMIKDESFLPVFTERGCACCVTWVCTPYYYFVTKKRDQISIVLGVRATRLTVVGTPSQSLRNGRMRVFKGSYS